MIVLFLFLVPLISGLAAFAIRQENGVKLWALLTSLITLALAIAGNVHTGSAFSQAWMGSMGSSFSLKLDGLSGILCLLTAVAYPLVLLATWKSHYSKAHNFYGLMLLTQAGLMGVFSATDALLFYFFWELALIPVYFLCSGWGGERRIPVTFKFFVYTFTGSVLMLLGLVYIYFKTPGGSFALSDFYALHLTGKEQSWLFWLMFIAFGVKMPIWPLHTWQPDTYEQSPTAVTMILSGIMVKMGVFGLLRWVWPIMPIAVHVWGDVVMSLAVIGIIYSSIVAIQQDDLKRLVAYSSIAHIGLMIMAIFSENNIGLQGVMMQMFNHGINIIGMWVVIELTERQFGTRKISELGGIAAKAPVLTIMLVIIAFANIALPLTNAFAGEFLMFNGIWNSRSTYRMVFAAVAAISIILAAVYTLRMIRRVYYGQTNERTATGHDLFASEWLALSLLVVMVIGFGFYPQSLLNMTEGFVANLFNSLNLQF